MWEIPVLHPVVVHFPIAYLMLAAAASVGFGVTGRRGWRNLTAVLLGAGVAGAVGAYITGETMEHYSEGVPIVQELVETHETMGMTAMLVAAGAFTVLVIAWLSGNVVRAGDGPAARDALWLRIVIVVLCVAAAALVAYTGHLGGTMTWGVEAG